MTGEELQTSVLDRVALAVNSSLDLGEVLERLASLALEVCPAHRASIFLLNPSGTHLIPRTYVAHENVSERIAEVEYATRPHFEDMDPIDLQAIPSRLSAFTQGRAFAIADLAESPLVPPEVVRQFKARSAIIIPLIAPDQPLGIMALDWMSPRDGFDEDELVLLEAIGGFASLAVRNARLFEDQDEKAASLESLVDVASALNSSLTLDDVRELARTSFITLLDAKDCVISPPDDAAIAGLDQEHIGTLIGACDASERPCVTDLPAPELGVPAAYPASQRSSVAVFPLRRSSDVRGFVLVTFDRAAALVTDAIELGRALGDLVTAALERAELYERLRSQLEMMELVQELSDAAAATSDLPSAIRRLNHLLAERLGIELESISLAGDRQQSVDAATPAAEELQALRTWRQLQATAHEPARPRTVGDAVLVPIVHRNRIQGVLRVRRTGRPPELSDEHLLLSLGIACADVINRSALRRDLDESERRLAIAYERERIARDLHNNVGQLVTALGMQLKNHADLATDDMWKQRFVDLAEQAAQGSRQIKDAIHSLLFLQVRRSGLVSSLRDLVQTFEATSGVATSLEVRGEPGNVHPAKEDVLFRVAHEAFTNIRRHSGASWAEISLSYDSDEIALAIRDFGRGFARDDDPFRPRSGHFGLGSLRQRLDEIGGELVVGNARPRGVLIEARIPLKRRRTAPTRSSARRGSTTDGTLE